MSDCSMPVVSLEKQNLSKLTELTTIYQHVWDISRKIAEMEGDPLPKQLEQSVPGYAAWLKKHTESLQRNKWPFVLTGNLLLMKILSKNYLLGKLVMKDI